MKTGFIDKFIDRLDRVDPHEIQSYVLRIVQEKGFLEKVFDALREGVIVTGARGTIHYLNRAACDLFGIERADSLGQPIATRIRGLDWEGLTRSGQVVSRDLEVFYPENRYVNFYIAPLEGDAAREGNAPSSPPPEDEDETLAGYVLLLRDITESRQVERDTIESEKLNALTVLAAGVAHEIGNPLNSLNIHLQLVERKLRKKAEPALAEELGRSLEIARDEIKRLDFIVEKFLGAVRPTQPRLEVADLNQIVRESVEFLAPEVADRDIRVRLSLRENLPPLRLDRDQMRQAFYNLIRNAAQAIGSGGELTVATNCDDYQVSVSFADTGPGISPENLGKVFEPYFTTKKTGSGLGLLIVHRIVREHGGEIEFASGEGSGTTVKIYLPRVEKQMRYLTGPGGESAAAEEVIDVEAAAVD
ncbi:MAG: PAS domain-containing protein [Akkermansiaceae bacterium]|nr:PAS domain-containing protein [Akkermansiaceae bacterium]MCP5550719.1 PAS domain-containing protein [Akkermansiaceae bacterium]